MNIGVLRFSSHSWLSQWPRMFGVGAEGARQMLSTLAGSMMTVMGITFSMTLLALVQASSQYTSRILRNFMRSRMTQFTLGVFAGIFAYCLIVLRTIRGVGVVAIVPSFEGLLADAFDQIRSSAGVNVTVLLGLLDALDSISGLTIRPGPTRALDEQVQRFAELADRGIESSHDRVRLQRRLAQVRETLAMRSALRRGT